MDKKQSAGRVSVCGFRTLHVCLLALLIGVSVPGSTRVTPARAGVGRGDWWMFRHDPQHTGRSPFVGPSAPTRKWAFTTGSYVESSPAVGADGTIYIGSDDGNFYALNPDGTMKWAFATGGLVQSSPAVGPDGTIYVGSVDKNVYALNQDGTVKWAFPTGWAVSSSPAVGSDGTIYVGSFDGNVYALNPDGTMKWAFATGDAVYSSPAVGSDGTIYVGSDDTNVYALNPDGTMKWAFGTGQPVRSSPTVGADGTIYADYALNPEGTQKWLTPHGWLLSSAAVGLDGTIYVGLLHGQVHAYNPDGTRKWVFLTERQVRSSPTVGADGTIYIGSMDGTVYALNPDGTQRWAFATGGIVTSSPAVGADGTIYIGSYDHNVYAIGSTVSNPPPTVTSITPTSGVNTDSVSITNLAGTGFLAGATVKLKKTGQADIVATDVAVVSSTQITCALDLTGAATGQWNVVVANTDDQSATLTNGFTINQGAFHDVALTSFTASPNPVSRGSSVSFNVTVKNLGAYTENGVTFTMNYKTMRLVGPIKLSNWKAGQEMSGVLKLMVPKNQQTGDYLITGQLSTVVGETNTDNNKQTVKLTVK